MTASAADAPGALTGPPRRRRLLSPVLLVLAALGLASGGVALGVRLAAAPQGSASVALVATVAAASHQHPALSKVSLRQAGGASVALTDSSAPSLQAAPALTDLGVHAAPAGDYTAVTATIGGHTMTAPLTASLRGGSLTPIALVVEPGGAIVAAAGNDDVNQALLQASGQIIHAPDVAFVDQDGRPVPLHSLRGRVLVVAALDTHCHDTCPLYTALWADLQRIIRERGWQNRVAIAEVSMDPDRDTPLELSAYARMVGATWPLLRADAASTMSFWLSLNATYYKAPATNPAPVDWYTGQPETYHLHHDSLAVVFDPSGDARYILQGDPRLGHPLSAPLARLESGGESAAQALEKVSSWSITDLLDRVDTLLGAPIESTRGTERAARPGARAPDFTATGLDGAPVSLHDFAGRAVVVTFWATWCTPCRHDMPLLATAARNHAGLVVLAVDEGESSGQVRRYLDGLLGADAALFTTALDPEQSAGGHYAVGGLPVTVFVGADGIVQAVRVGQLQSGDLTTVLASTGA